MANISQVRGALLEEAVLYLLEKYGYETILSSSLLPGDESLRAGHSGLDVRGRGSWHQIDALAALKSTPSFMYPLRLMVEAKCYQPHRPVGIEVVRNAVGVLKDISENYFSVPSRGSNVQVPRFNYHTAIFSTSGYTSGAVDYALAHQVFLIQYQNVPVIQPLIDGIMSFDDTCITRLGKNTVTEVRKRYRSAIRDQLYLLDTPQYITVQGTELIDNALVQSLRRINGSYFGMLQGRWPLHLLTDEPLPSEAFQSDVVQCHVRGFDNGEWTFTPAEFEEGTDGWFELEFNLPSDIANLVAQNWGDRIVVAEMKQEYFSHIDLTGLIGDMRRSVRLELDQNWIESYIQSSQRRR